MQKPEIIESRLLNRTLLSRNKGDKGVYLLELDLGESKACYNPGDVLCVFSKNIPEVVEKVLEAAKFSGDEQVQSRLFDKTISLRQLLADEYELESLNSAGLAHLRSSTNKEQTSLVGLLQDYKGILTVDQFVAWLKPARPRAYSIASSQKLRPNSVELIVALVEYVDENGLAREGFATGYLCKRLELLEETFYISLKSTHFKLPQNPQAPVIMIGPGTGVAPFKGFLEERRALGASGKNWLFFGDRHRANDFILEEQWEIYLKEGLLTRLELAFSRDQSHKIYVQHKILENAPEVWQWIQEGGYLYVCGDAKHMAKDVERALLEVISLQGGMKNDEAESFLKMLRKEGRYQKDVY